MKILGNFRSRSLLLSCLFFCALFTAPPEKARAETTASPALAASTENPEKALLFLQRQAASLASLSCEFIQESTIPLFAQPVTSTGILRFKRPDKLVWQYTKPVQAGFALNGSKGFRWEGSRENRMEFTTANDPVASFVGTQLLSWIRFDLESIRARYAIEVQSNAPLTLLLTPTREEVRSVLRALQISFDDQGIAQTVTLFEAQGGTTSIRFLRVQANAPLSDEAFE